MSATESPTHRTALLTEREVADLFRVTRRTIQRWATGGTLVAIRVGGVTRYRQDDVIALIDASSAATTNESPRRQTEALAKERDAGARLGP